MIQIQHLTKRFAAAGATVVALNDINLEIQDGDIYGIIGMSGAGKSTLVRCINMLERPDEGKVIVDGREMMQLSPAELRDARREITMIFQQFNLLVVEEGNENEPAIKALVAALTSQTVKDYIDSTYDGAVVAIF